MKKIAFLMVMCLVSLIALTSATYAKFSEQYNPEIGGLQFGVATQEYLMISKTGEVGTFKDILDFSEFIDNPVTLNPLEGKVDTTNLSINLYDGQFVANENDNYIKFTLYFTGSSHMKVSLKGSTTGKVVDIVGGSNINSNEQIENVIKSLRIGFIGYNTREVPTGTGGVEYEYDPIRVNVYSVHEKQDFIDYQGIMPYQTFSNISHEGLDKNVTLVETSANEISKMDISMA